MPLRRSVRPALPASPAPVLPPALAVALTTALATALATVLAATLAALPAGAAGAVSGAAGAASERQAPRWGSQTEMMVVADPAIDEASGLTRSTFKRRLIWVHNDSGDTARVFAVGPWGKTRGTLSLTGARAIDWEDIAAGPNHRLWVADTGDNDGDRSTVQVIKFREPRKVTRRHMKSRTYSLAYPDGPHDAEALMVDPDTAQVYVVTKSKAGGGIYRAPDPLVPGARNVMTRVGSAPAIVTGADFLPSGTSFVLRTYTTAYVYPRLGAAPNVIALPHQRQGESIGFNRSGRALLIGSEGVDQPVWRIR